MNKKEYTEFYNNYKNYVTNFLKKKGRGSDKVSDQDVHDIVSTHAIASVAKQNSKNLFLSLFQPFYYLLQSISAYRAVWKFFNGSAMVWEKTEHLVEE